MKRALFNDLKKHAEKKQITLLVGARQTGKTTLLQQLKSSFEKEKRRTYFLTLEDPAILELLNSHPDKLFQVVPPLNDSQKTFILIDEVQYLNNPSNFLKYLYDLYAEKLKFMVSGSSGFYIDEKFKDSLAGRKRIFTLPTLTFEEMLIFKNRDDIKEYVHTGNIPQVYVKEMYSLFQEYLLYGGYPEVVLEPNMEEKKQIIAEIANSYVKKDVLETKMKYPDAYLSIMRILAAETGSLLNLSKIGGNVNLEHRTVEAYIRLMRKSFHVTLVKPFFRNLPKELRRMPKIYFNDLGLRNHFIRNFDAIALREDKGAIFENYVFRLFLDNYGEDDIKFWRTQKQQEVDFIIQDKKAYEVKFSKNLYKADRYIHFKNKYPQIPLQLIHYDNVLGFQL